MTHCACSSFAGTTSFCAPWWEVLTKGLIPKAIYTLRTMMETLLPSFRRQSWIDKDGSWRHLRLTGDNAILQEHQLLVSSSLSIQNWPFLPVTWNSWWRTDGWNPCIYLTFHITYDSNFLHSLHNIYSYSHFYSLYILDFFTCHVLIFINVFIVHLLSVLTWCILLVSIFYKFYTLLCVFEVPIRLKSMVQHNYWKVQNGQKLTTDTLHIRK